MKPQFFVSSVRTSTSALEPQRFGSVGSWGGFLTRLKFQRSLQFGRKVVERVHQLALSEPEIEHLSSSSMHPAYVPASADLQSHSQFKSSTRYFDFITKLDFFSQRIQI
jgi:hypothetical protein